MSGTKFRIRNKNTGAEIDVDQEQFDAMLNRDGARNWTRLAGSTKPPESLLARIKERAEQAEKAAAADPDPTAEEIEPKEQPKSKKGK